jgi:iron complex transport system substrate-binding protein
MPASRLSRPLCVLTVLLMTAVLLAACGDDDSGGGALTVTDALDRTVQLEGSPERITVAGRAALLVVDALYLFPEGRERLVALEKRGQNIEGFLAIVDANWGEKTILEQNAGAEQIAPTTPDLVIAKSAMAEELGPPLDAVAIPVFYVDLETPEQFERDLAALGEVLGDPGRAEEVAGFYQERLDRIAEATAGLAADARPSVLLIEYSDEEGTVAFSVPPAGWLQTTIVELAGGEPIWTEASEGGGWTVVGLEQIAAWDPDQIYVVDYNGDSDGIVEELQADSRWQALAAVQAGSIYGFPGDFISWDQPDTRWILGLTWLFTKVQPGLAGDVDVMEEVRAFFGEMYSLDSSVVEDEIVPRLFGSLP